MYYVFADYTLDTQRYELRRSGALVHMEPRVFNVLAYLIQHRQRVASRDELFEHLWPEQFVTDDALGRCIQKARHALGERPEAPQYIKTIRGRGYRFVAAVQEFQHGIEATPVSVPLIEASEERSHRSEPPGFLACALEGEYKQVTVLCGALSDAPALALRLGPEAMHQVMQTVFTVVQQVMGRYAGSLIEFGVDGVLALFGAPVAQEDHARRAVLAAIALLQPLREALAVHGQPQGEPSAVCLGIHTGHVVVGRLGGEPQQLYTASGETVQLAARLRQLAEPGAILISATTQQLVQAEVQVVVHGGIGVGVLTAPVYSVRGLSRRRSGVVGRGVRKLSPFVGRDRELALLQVRLAAVAAGEGQAVGLVGEPGMGKSRLLTEFRDSLSGEGVTYYEGHCLSYGSATAYLPVLDILRQLCGITETDVAQALIAKLHQRLQQSGMDPEAGAPLLLQLLDVPAELGPVATLSAPARKARTFAMLRQLVLHAAQRQLLILTIENLHWIDATSAEWLASLAERLSGAMVLLLGSYRPGYQPSWLSLSAATQIALPRLQFPDSLTVVQAVCGTTQLPDAMVQEIVAKADGNPFFLEELAWYAVEHRGEHRPLQVPDTIETVLAERIDRLPADDKRLLQIAAVIGKDVPLPLLQAMAALPEETLHCALGHLHAAEFLYEMALSPEPVYTFKHALTQEVAYASLLTSTRQQVHQQVAELLEARFPETVEGQPELIAQHYTAAGLPEQAIPHWQRAGQRALQRSANHEALWHLTTGLKLLGAVPDTPERPRQELDFQLALGLALRLAKGYAAPELGPTYARARALCQQVGDAPQLAQVLYGLGGFYIFRAEYQTAWELGEQLLRLAQHQDDDALLLEAHRLLAAISVFLGEFATACAHAERGIALYDLQQHHAHAEIYGLDPGMTCTVYAAWALWYLGYPEQARQRMQAALTLAQERAHPPSLASALYCSSLLHVWRREPQLAQARAERAIHVATDQGLPQWGAAATAVRGWALVMQGQSAAGIAQGHQGLDAWRALGPALNMPWWLALLAEAYGHAGQPAAGLTRLAEALERMNATGEGSWEAELYRLQGTLLLRQAIPDDPQAEICFRQALAVARRQQARSWELRAAIGLSQLWQQQGQRAKGRALLAEVYGWFTEGFDTADLQDAKALLETLQE
jgi:predicted ATPase/class 3 adenylate cyclase